MNRIKIAIEYPCGLGDNSIAMAWIGICINFLVV